LIFLAIALLRARVISGGKVVILFRETVKPDETPVKDREYKGIIGSLKQPAAVLSVI
jgi:hypothetical protein